MERLSRRKDVASAAFLSLCMGLMGCLNMNDDPPPLANPYPQYRPTTAPPALAAPALAAPTANSPTRGPGGYLGASSAVDPNVRQAGFAQMQPGQQQFPPQPQQMPQGMQPQQMPPGMQPQQMPPGMQPQGGQPQVELMPDPSTMGPMDGAMGPPPNMSIPTEMLKVTHSPHRIAAPDILYLESLRLVPKGPYKLEPLEVVSLEVPDTLPKQDIKGLFMISPEGTINLGFNYGPVRIGGLTVDQAQAAIRNHLAPILKNPTINLALVQMRGMQNIRGQHLVRPDGTINLGMYGSVFVAGMTLGQAKGVIQTYLGAYLVDPEISVDVFAYNSRKIYVIADGAGYGQQVITLPATGNETVLDVIGRVGGLPAVSSLHRIWVARPSPAGSPTSTVLPVDWQAITQGGRTETNYQLLPGDRVYIDGAPLIKVYNYLDKMIAPVERVLGVTLLGQFVYNNFRNIGNGTGTSGLLIR